ncbi:hypothetical protein V2J09_024215 [Rumex salicifolius]
MPPRSDLLSNLFSPLSFASINRVNSAFLLVFTPTLDYLIPFQVYYIQKRSIVCSKIHSMDSQQVHRFSAMSADLSPPTLPEHLFRSAKLNSRNSPNSPFESDIATPPSYDNSLEQHSPIEMNGYYYRPTPSSSSSFHGGYDRFLMSHNPNGAHSVNHTLMQLETALMGPDNQDDQFPSRQSKLGSQQHCLKQLLIDCAKALYENRLNDFDTLVKQARSLVSITGDPVQRLGAYMIEGLVARKESSGTGIYRSLRCKEPAGRELLSYMHILYEVCPYLKFGYMAANGAIAEACRNEDRIHIIDFQIAQGTQWMTLLQALAARPGGPPSVRITGVDDPISNHARGTSLDAVGKRLAAISNKFKIPVEFHTVPVFGPKVTRDMIDVRPGEVVAVNFPLQLHHTPDESVDVENPRDGLLRLAKSLSPKVTTIVEQESNTNTTPFLTRFVETLDYYSAMFESIDVTMGRDRKERVSVEEQCLAKDIVNVIACEGKDRVERHELLGKWRSRLTMAGFRPYPMSSYVNSVIRGLVRCYSEHYTLVEKDGAMLLGWKDRMLISASAWH